MSNSDYSKLPKGMIELLNESTHDPYLGDIALQKNPKDIVPIYSGKVLIGFAIPRKESDGRWRSGPIFITAKERGKGFGGKWLVEFFKHRRGRSYINPTNQPSIQAFTKAGFYATLKSIKDDEEVLVQYLKD